MGAFGSRVLKIAFNDDADDVVAKVQLMKLALIQQIMMMMMKFFLKMTMQKIFFQPFVAARTRERPA